MESIFRLRELLSIILSNNSAVRDEEQELFDELMVQKPRLLNLLEVGGRNANEKREIESGQININGARFAVNADFARQAIFLSEQLNCSERYAAEILRTITTQNPNIDAVQTLELSVAEFHERRRALVDCISLLIEATETNSSTSSETQQRISNYVLQELIQASVNSQPWPLRIFRTVDSLDTVITAGDNARRGAGSNTIAPTGQGAPVLGFEVLNSRYESLKYERRNLAIIFCRIAQTGNFTPEEVRAVLEWLPIHSNHAMTFYSLAAILAALDSSDPSSSEGKKRQTLATTPATIAAIKSALSTSMTWQDSGLKATIQLKWTLCATEARHLNPNLESREGFGTEELETQISNSAQGGAFSYLALAVIQIQGRTDGLNSFLTGTLSLSAEQQELRQVPPEDFKPIILATFETLLRSLITHASSELRKIKQRQEDIVLANARSDRMRASTSRFASSTAPSEASHRPTPRSDIPMLYTLIGLLYSALPPERALQFWGAGLQEDTAVTYAEYVESTSGRLPTFLQWAVWSTSVHDLTMLSALYEMLSGLANGQQCSELAYNFMARGGGEVIPGSSLSGSTSGPSVSWSAVFALLEAWATNSQNSRTQVPSNQPPGLSTTLGGSTLNTQNQVTIGPKEVFLAQSFLRLLSVVVTHSVAVRVAISGHAQFRAIPTLVSLIPIGIPLELKGSIFDTLSAFCKPGAGVPGVEICKAVWTLMERLEVINVRASSSAGFGAPKKGVEAELDEVEAPHKIYPSTISFLKLLSTLLHTPKRIPLQDRLLEVQPTNTIPETLGQPYRLPGIAPFTSFVVDNVFARIPSREYSDATDRWKINDLCLSFVERALASFDLESLLTAPDGQSPKNEALLPLVVHPGHDIMKRMLTNSTLQSNILSYLVDGIQGFEKGLASEQPVFGSMVTRVLRIVHRILEIQDLFLDVFIPLLSNINNTAMTGTIHPRSYFTKFDQALTYGSQYIPSIAAYVSYPGNPELVYMSIKTLTQLSISTSSNLTGLIARSSESDRIMAGYMHVLVVESMDDVYEAETFAEQATGAGAPDVDQGANLAQANRLAALDLLAQETGRNRTYPNVGNFLLFGGLAANQLQDPNALGAKKTVIHVLLDLVNDGVPRLKGREKDTSYTTPLSTTLPGLAERCYRVIYQLCTHARTSEFITRYLRTREDFFTRQIASIPTIAPQTTSKNNNLQVQYADGSWVNATVESFTSFLRLRSRIFDLVALDLHILTHKGQLKGVSDLLQVLFGNAVTDDEGAFYEMGQSHMRIIEFLQSLSFAWYDSLIVKPVDLQFLGRMNLQSCMRRDASGCEVVDRNALLALLTTAKKTLHSQNVVVTPAHLEQLQREAAYILESCVVENHRREVAHAVSTAYESWRNMLDIVLTKCFDRLPHDQRESMLFDLLHVLPGAIQSPDIGDSTAVILSEVIFSSVTKLREDRRQQIIAQSASGSEGSSSLPAERLYTIFRSMLEGVLNNNPVELVRGNLYASLINYVHLIFSPEKQHGLRTVNLPVSTLVSDRSFDIQLQSVAKSLTAGSMTVLKSVTDRLIATITRDAIDGTEVWKTVAFMLLDALVQLSTGIKQDAILAALARNGILSNFVRGIKESDSRLLSVLKPDPDDLNALYVYEAKMSLFVRMSQTRAGAERLLDSHLVLVLGQCDYLDARPETDQSFIDRDSFLPSAIQRYHQLLTPALQVVDGLLATLGNKHNTAVNQILDFLTSHGPTLVILLKNESEEVPVLLLEEIHLIVTLCSSVLSSVPKTEISSPNSGFGALHSAILNLATRCLSSDQCFRYVAPQSDTELAQSRLRAFGYGTESVFDTVVHRKERLLRKSIIAYAGAASQFTESDITLVLSPITTPQRKDERLTTGFLSTIPTVGDVLEALVSLHDELSQTLQQVVYLTTELGARDQIAVENIHEAITDVVDASLLQDLDVHQKRELICEELRQVRGRVMDETRILLDTTEMLLLLVWRHIQHYTSLLYTMPSAPSGVSLSTSFLGRSQSENQPLKQNNLGINAAMRFLAAPNPETFKQEVGRKLGPILGRLEELDLSILDHELVEEGAYRHTTQSQQSREYFEIMARRLRDSVGLLLENETGLGMES